MMGDRQVKAGASAVLVVAKRSERGMAHDLTRLGHYRPGSLLSSLKCSSTHSI